MHAYINSHKSLCFLMTGSYVKKLVILNVAQYTNVDHTISCYVSLNWYISNYLSCVIFNTVSLLKLQYVTSYIGSHIRNSIILTTYTLVYVCTCTYCNYTCKHVRTWTIFIVCTHTNKHVYVCMWFLGIYNTNAWPLHHLGSCHCCKHQKYTPFCQFQDLFHNHFPNYK